MSKKNKRVYWDISLYMWICTHVYAYTTFCRMEADKVCKLVHEAMRRRKGEEDCRRAVGNSGQQWLAHYFRVHCVISKCLLNFWEEPIATLEWVFRMKTFLPLKFCSLLHKLSWTYFLLSFLMTSFMLPSLQVHLISESLSKKEEGSSIHFFLKHKPLWLAIMPEESTPFWSVLNGRIIHPYPGCSVQLDCLHEPTSVNI